LELLKSIQSKNAFSQMLLVGGTALALQIGHRKSIYLDFFGKLNADELQMTGTLSEIGKTIILKKANLCNEDLCHK